MSSKSFSDFGISLPAGASGPEVYTTCPQCSETRKKKNSKCLSVNVEKRVWHCWHCDWVGGLGESKLPPPSRRKPKEFKKPEPRDDGITSQMLSWFDKRGITPEVLTRNQIRATSVYFPQLEDTVPALVFPYFRQGDLINRKYRALASKHFRMEAGCELVLYGLDDIPADGELIYVEGEMDKLALEVAGYTNVVSVPNGAPPVNSKNYESQFGFLDSAREKIQAVKRHIIAVDADGPGARLEEELSRRLGVEKCWRVRWPEGCKDANDVLLKHGTEELRWYIANCQAFPIDGGFGIDNRRNDLVRVYQRGFERGQRTGWRELDKYYTVRAGEFTAVTGIPSSGKSNFLDALCVNLAKLHDWKFLFFSPENLPLEQHMAAILEKYVGQPFHEGYSNRMTEIELMEAMDWASDKFFWLMPGNQAAISIDKILETAALFCLRYGIRGLVIDPWNELEPLRPSGMLETEYISESLTKVKNFARSRGVHVWVVIHPAKLSREKDGKYPVPSLYDCAGSAHWRNKADNGLCIWRDLSDAGDKAEVYVYVQKIRFRQIGRRGTAKLIYEPGCASYRDEHSLKTAANN